MEKRQLGPLTVSTIGIGCMGMTHAYGGQPDAASVAASKTSVPAGRRSDAPTEVVCMALALALLALASRIASFW